MEGERPTDDELDRMYRHLLEELNIPVDKRSLMMSQPMNMKWKLLSKHQRYVKVQSNPYGSFGGAAKMVGALDKMLLQSDLVKEEQVLEICMDIKTEPEWLNVFTELGGLGKLVHLLDFVQERNEVRMETDLVKCLLSLVSSSQNTMDVIISDPDAVTIIALCLTKNSNHQKLNTFVIQILNSVITHSQEGYETFLTAMEVFRLERHEMRFETIMHHLKTNENVAFQTQVLQLVNKSIENAKNIEDRMVIRSDFMYLAILKVLDDLSGMIKLFDQQSEDLLALQQQLNTFHVCASQDNAQVLECAPATGSWLSDPEILMSKVLEVSNNSGCSNELIEILHALLVIPDDPHLAKNLWTLLAETAQKLATSPESVSRMSYTQIEEMYLTRNKRFSRMSNNKTQELKSQNDMLTAQLIDSESKYQKLELKYKKQLEEQAIVIKAPMMPEEDSKFAKYSRMNKSGVPEGAIRNMMTKDGLLEQEQQDFFNSFDKIDGNVVAPSVQDSKLAKYQRMKTAGLPQGAIVNAMVKDGVSKQDQDNFFGITDSKFEKYLKMQKAQLPQGAIQNQMIKDGLAVEDQNQFFKSGSLSIPELCKLPNKPKTEPRKPMRALFWSKLPNSKVEGSWWETMDDSCIDIDPDSLEDQFSTQTVVVVEQKVKDDQPAIDADKPVELLEPKRLQNTGIAFARLRITPKMLAVCIKNMDLKKLGGGIDRVVLLKIMVPTGEEKALITDYDGDVAKLGKIEQLFLELSQVELLDQRIRAWEIYLKFKVQVIENQENGQVLLRACTQLRNSKAFKQTLLVILAMGNYMNGTSARGGAYGFKLDTLSKLENLRSTDKKTNLLRFIVQDMAQNKYPIMLNLPQDLSAVTDASKISFTGLCDNFKNLEKDLLMVKDLTMQLQNEESCFASKMHEFIDASEKTFHHLKITKEKISSEYGLVLQTLALADDPELQHDTEPLFKQIDSFVQSFRREMPPVQKQKRNSILGSVSKDSNQPVTPRRNFK